MKALLKKSVGAVFALLTILSLFFAFGRYVSFYETKNISFWEIVTAFFYVPSGYTTGFALLVRDEYGTFETALLLSVIFCGLILIGTILKFVKRTPLKDKIIDFVIITLSILLIISVLIVLIFMSKGLFAPIYLPGGPAGVKLGGGAFMYLIFAALCFLASFIGGTKNTLKDIIARSSKGGAEK